MIGAIGAYNSAAAIDYARRVIAPREAFAVPESQLRNNPVTEAQGAQAIAATNPLRDPAADAVQLSQMYPQLLVGSIYTAAPASAVMGLEQEPVGAADNQDRDNAEVMGELLFGGQGRNRGTQTGVQAGGAQNGLGVTDLSETGEAVGVKDEADDSAEGTGEADGKGKSAATDPNGQTDKAAGGGELSEEQQRQVEKLKARDLEVKAHEQAHKAVGGAHAGAISYEYQQGPDGKRYAVGGEVSIDVSKAETPEATIAKMQQVKAAANAPANPSGQDRAVAAEATALEGQARVELAQADSSESSGEGQEATEISAANAVSGGIATLSSANSPDQIGGAQVNAASAAEASGSSGSGGGMSLSSNSFVNRFASRYEGGGGYGYGTGILGQGSSNSRLVDVVA